MTPTSTSTRADQQARRRARVVDTARRLAEDGGYDAVQMRAVAQQADVALGTIYRYFASKDQLLLAVLSQVAEQLEGQINEHPPTGTTAAERVADVTGRCCAVLEANPRLGHAMVTALSTSDPSGVEMRDAVNEQLKTIIGKALDGQFGDRLDDFDDIVHVLGMVWFAAMQGWISGRTPSGSMSEELAIAARLLLTS